MKIGYVRVSSADQNEDRQLEALEKQGVDRVFIDKRSGKDLRRPQLQDMLSFCREGDIIITESISRIARSVSDLLHIMDILKDKDVVFGSGENRQIASGDNNQFWVRRKSPQ